MLQFIWDGTPKYDASQDLHQARRSSAGSP